MAMMPALQWPGKQPREQLPALTLGSCQRCEGLCHGTWRSCASTIGDAMQVSAEALAQAGGAKRSTGTYVGCMFVDYMNLQREAYSCASTGGVSLLSSSYTKCSLLPFSLSEQDTEYTCIGSGHCFT